MSSNGLTLVLGGARSGKSRYAERIARSSGLARVYLAMAQALDDEMAGRIARHREDRAKDGWRTIEEPIGLPAALARNAAPGVIVLADCLTLWLTNLMLGERDLAASQSALLSVLRGARGPVILVSNEVGLGIVPETPLGRAFRDAQGQLNQAVAAICDDVVFIAAGLPLVLKQPDPG